MENARLESYPRGSVVLAGAEWRWYDMSTPAKTEIGADEPFVPGRTYAVECTLRPSAGFMACEYTDCYVWDQNSRGAYIGGLEPDMIFITGQYTVPGEEPAVYQPAPVIVPDDTAYVVPGSQDNVYDTTVTLDKIELEIDEPRVGVTYPDLKWRFRDPEGIDAGKVRFRWMEKASGTPAAAWEEISEIDEFEAGSAFGFDMYVALEKGYAVTSRLLRSPSRNCRPRGTSPLSTSARTIISGTPSSGPLPTSRRSPTGPRRPPSARTGPAPAARW